MISTDIQPHSKTARVLLVEDDTAILDMMHEYLKDHYQVHCFSNGGEALAFARKTLPDVIISDVSMPEVGGYDLLRTLRNDETTMLIPFIFLTGHSDYNDMRSGMVKGADDYLIKPIDMRHLQRAIEAQLEKQQAKRQQLESTVRDVRESLTYSLPHELRTPLFQIIGYVDMLQSEFETLDTKTSQHFLGQITKATERMHRLVENYCVHLQLEAVATDEKRRRALRNHIVRDVAVPIQSVVENLAGVHKREADIDLKAAPQSMQISEQNIHKIAYELIDNALKFSSPGSVVSVAAFPQDGEYHLIIHDGGEGMTPTQLQQLGQPFLQFERERQEQQGIGLGFSIAQQLVNFHDGQLTVKSKPGVGTRIHITLPV